MTALELLIASWGVAGAAALIVRALFALTPIALEPIREGALNPWHWALLLGWVLVNLYAEGYRGFHRSFSPRVVNRALALARNPRPLRVLLAGPYCIGLFAASRRVLITSWGLVFIIVALVVWVRQLAQPWRGIIDAGVVVGLGAGLLSLLVVFIRAILHRSADDGDTPTGPSV